MPVRHTFESAVVDNGDPNEVGPDEWNADHTGSSFDFRSQSVIDEECFFSGTASIYAGGVTGQVSGTGAAISNGFGEVTDPGFGAVGTGVQHPGIIVLSTGTTTTGRCALAANQGLSSGNVFLYTGSVRFGTTLRLNSLSDGSQTYTYRAGLGLSITGDGTDGIWFRYTHSVNGGRWQGVTLDSSSESTLDTGVSANTDPYTTLEFQLADDASEVEFFIDGTSVGTISTDIPTSNGVSLVPASIIKSAGSTARTASVDAYWYVFDFTEGR